MVRARKLKFFQNNKSSAYYKSIIIFKVYNRFRNYVNLKCRVRHGSAKRKVLKKKIFQKKFNLWLFSWQCA